MTIQPFSNSLLSGFLKSAEEYPQRPALYVDGITYSYEQLLKIVERLAGAIVFNSESNESMAAVFGQRSIGAFSGILAVLRSGRGYVPLNPKFPAERIRRVLELSGVSTMVLGKEAFRNLEEILPQISKRLTIISLDDLSGLAVRFPGHTFIGPAELQDASFNVPAVAPDAVAYLLFTSGSTGEPKGVAIRHSNVTTYLRYIARTYDLSEQDRFSQMPDLTFDLSIHDVFVCWEVGACLFCLPKAATWAPAKFINEHEITVWTSVPSMTQLLSKLNFLNPGQFPKLRHVFFCGEALLSDWASAWQLAAPNAKVENLYGPTEATVSISSYTWDQERSPAECRKGVVPIGRIFPSQEYRIVDADLNSVPSGETGELCLSGSQVIQRYFSAEDAAKSQFVKLPESSDSIWYRTGDLVCADDRGCLHYVGRADHQLKIRGFRVELREIENAVGSAAKVQLVVAVPWKYEAGRAEGIYCFIEGEELDAVSKDSVLKDCRKLLPDYMVPTDILSIKAMPLSGNGKIDRSALSNILIQSRKNH